MHDKARAAGIVVDSEGGLGVLGDREVPVNVRARGACGGKMQDCRVSPWLPSHDEQH